jgi:MFS family permease
MTPPSTRERSTRVLWLVPAVYLLFVAAELAALTQLALQATAHGRSALAVGLLASVMWGGILLGSTQAHAAVQRAGHGRVFVSGTAVSALALATLPLHGQFGAWLAALFVLGVSAGLVWVAGESWLAEAAPPARRGLFVGLFETAVGLGLMAGPALVPLSRHFGVSPLVTAAALMGLTLLLAAALWREALPPRADAVAGAGEPAAEPAAWRVVAFPLIVMALLGGAMEGGVSALLPSVSMRAGFGFEEAAWLGAVIGAGSALLQPPVGVLADRLGVPRTMVLAWGVVVAANAVMLAMAAEPARVLWAAGFVLGGFGGAVYTLAIVEMGHRLAGGGLVKAISALVVAYAVGTTAGPLLGGAVFTAGGLHGLAGLLLGLSLAGLVWCLWSTRQPNRPGAR